MARHPYRLNDAAWARNLGERMFGRLKGLRRIATRHDKLAGTFLASVVLAAIVIWWI